MDSNGAGDPETAESTERAAVIARERAADERSRLVEERERRADEREAMANQRERKADEREALADARERTADRREVAATEREKQTDRREEELSDRERVLGAAVDHLEERVLDAIERSRALLALNAQRLDRQEAEVKRSQEQRQRQQAEISRAAAETEGKLADWLPDPSSLSERGTVLRKRARLAMQAFASNEEEAARLYQDLAARNPEHREEYLHEAQHARTSAGSAREYLRQLRADVRPGTLLRRTSQLCVALTISALCHSAHRAPVFWWPDAGQPRLARLRSRNSDGAAMLALL